MSLRARTSVLDEWLGSKVFERNGSGRLQCWLGISGWRATSDCGSWLFSLVTESVIYSWWLIWRLQLCCKSGVHFLSNCHLCVDLVGLLRQLPAFSVQICKSQRPLRAKFRCGSCSSRLQVYTRDNLTIFCKYSNRSGILPQWGVSGQFWLPTV